MGDNTPGSASNLCMECWCSRFNRPAGQRQATAEDRPGNPKAVLPEIQPTTQPIGFGHRLETGFRWLGESEKDNR